MASTASSWRCRRFCLIMSDFWPATPPRGVSEDCRFWITPGAALSLGGNGSRGAVGAVLFRLNWGRSLVEGFGPRSG
jgi:hypothetical protein